MKNQATMHFDTIYSTYSTDPIETTFNFSNPIRKIKSIKLASVEFPIGWYNVRSSNNSNVFTITIGSITSTITLSQANYSSMSTLISAINTSFGTLSLTNSPTFSISNNKVVITLTSSATITITNTVLSQYICGFSSNYSATGTSFTSSSNYNLAYDTYIMMYFDSLPVNNFSVSNQISHFKIPFSGINNTIYYLYENSSFNQYLELSDSSYIMTNLKVSFYDRFNKKITSNNGLDYSFSLKFDFFDE